MLVGYVAREAINLISALGRHLKAIKSCLLISYKGVLVYWLCVKDIARGHYLEVLSYSSPYRVNYLSICTTLINFVMVPTS